MRVAICFSCNEAYAPLAKGLALSLRDALRFIPAGYSFSPHFIDIGCTDSTLAWMQENGTALASFSRQDYPLLPEQGMLPSYADAQLCRPFLPQIVPGYDIYVWIDSDIWLQGHDAVTVPAQAVAGFQDKIVICPEYHYGYIGHRDLRLAVIAQQRWYGALYREESLVEALSFSPMYNSGFFAMRGDSRLWGAWAKELASLYAKDHSADPSVLHYAEQLGLNRILYDHQAQIPLDPLFNYACGGSSVFVNPSGKVVVGYPPCTPVKGVHLLAFSRYGKMYLEKGFLYKQGAYLSSEEKQLLASLVQ